MPLDLDTTPVADPNADLGVADPNGSVGGDDHLFNSILDDSMPVDLGGTQPLPKEDPSRLEYHQSRADKIAAERELIARENELLRRELESRKAFDPLIDFVKKDEDAYQYLEGRIRGQQPKQAEAPKPPAKPANFSMGEAASDPNSPSAKYLQEREEYMEARIAYVEERERTREAEVRAMREQREAEAQKQTQIGSLRTHLMQNEGMSQQDAEDFIQTMSDPRSMRLDNLIRLWKMTKDASNGQPARRTSPAPPVGGRAAQAGRLDDSQAFAASMKGWDQRQRYIPERK